MPTGVKILIYLDSTSKDLVLSEVRQKFMSALQLNEDDFYVGGSILETRRSEWDWLPYEDENGKWFDLNLLKSYYEEGYERGDIKLFVKIAEWFECKLLGCHVYYGNDCDDHSLVLFDDSKRSSLLKYFHAK